MYNYYRIRYNDSLPNSTTIKVGEEPFVRIESKGGYVLKRGQIE